MLDWIDQLEARLRRIDLSLTLWTRRPKSRVLRGLRSAVIILLYLPAILFSLALKFLKWVLITLLVLLAAALFLWLVGGGRSPGYFGGESSCYPQPYCN